MLLQGIRQRLPAALPPELIAAALLLAGGAVLRLYALGGLPPGFNHDETAAAYDAWALLHYGIDRNGFSWPVHFVSWGSGQNALYSYLAMPFIALGGLTVAVARLPMALSGVLTLFLMWRIGERAGGRGFALLVLLLLSLSSWHIMASRWANEANLLPFVLLLSVYFLSREDRGRFHIQAIAVAVLALSVYAYGTAYAFAPLFLTLVLVWLMLNRLADWRRLLALCALAGIVALPIMLLVAINSLGWDTIEVLGVSIPRYSGPPRYEKISLLFSGDGERFWSNWPRLSGLLLNWSGGLSPGRLMWFGPLPPLAILLALVGLAIALYRAKAQRDYGVHLLLVFWFGAALVVALLAPAQIIRVNALWLPAIYLIGAGAYYIGRRRRVILYGLTAAYIAYSGLFFDQYLRNYGDVMGAASYFRIGVGAAIERAVAAAGEEAIYVADHPVEPLQPYIYALFYTRTPPREYRATRVVATPNAAFKQHLAYGQFVFVAPWRREGEKHYWGLLHSGGIDLDAIAHYVLDASAVAELATAGLVMERYGNYYYAYNPAVAAAGPARGPLLRIDRPAVAEPPVAQARFSIYREGNGLTYYKENCADADTREKFFLHFIPVNAADLPAERRELGFANRDFRFDDYGALYGRNCWAVVPLPDYPVAGIRTGQFVDGKGEIWRAEFR